MQAKGPFGRTSDLLIARDFLTIKVPAGGYTDSHNNMGFDLDLTYVTNRIRPATQELSSQISNNDNNQNFNIKAFNVNVKSYPKQPSSNQSAGNKMDNFIQDENALNYNYSYVHTSRKKHVHNDTDRDDYNDIYSISSVLKSNSVNEEKWENESLSDYTESETSPPLKREEEHVYNKANMDKWNFNYNVPVASAINHNGNGYRKNNLDNPRNKTKKKK